MILHFIDINDIVVIQNLTFAKFDVNNTFLIHMKTAWGTLLFTIQPDVDIMRIAS